MRALLVTSAVIVAAAVAAPRYLTPRFAAPTATAPANAVMAASNPSGREVRIAAGRDGHFYLDAFVGARPIRFMVDTGATTVALRESDAASIGLRIRPADLSVPIQTANGDSFAAQGEVDRMDVEGIEIDDVAVLILPDAQLGISLLGGSFLNRLRRFEVANGTLVFQN